MLSGLKCVQEDQNIDEKISNLTVYLRFTFELMKIATF